MTVTYATSNNWAVYPSYPPTLSISSNSNTFVWTYNGVGRRCRWKYSGLERTYYVSRPKNQVYHLTEGDWFVRGVTDLAEAASLLMEESEIQDQAHMVIEEGHDWELKIVGYERGRFRFVPCTQWCGEHGWHLIPQRQHAGMRGSFEGIWISDVEFEQIDDVADLNDPWLDT